MSTLTLVPETEIQKAKILADNTLASIIANRSNIAPKVYETILQHVMCLRFLLDKQPHICGNLEVINVGLTTINDDLHLLKLVTDIKMMATFEFIITEKFINN